MQKLDLASANIVSVLEEIGGCDICLSADGKSGQCGMGKKLSELTAAELIAWIVALVVLLAALFLVFNRILWREEKRELLEYERESAKELRRILGP